MLPVCVCLCICLYVNQGGTNCNCYTQRLVILHAQTYWKPWLHKSRFLVGQSDLIYRSKSSAEKVGVTRHVAASCAKRHSPWDACVLLGLQALLEVKRNKPHVDHCWPVVLWQYPRTYCQYCKSSIVRDKQTMANNKVSSRGNIVSQIIHASKHYEYDYMLYSSIFAISGSK